MVLNTSFKMFAAAGCLWLASCGGGGGGVGAGGGKAYQAVVDWDRVEAVSKTELSIQVCPEPPMRRGHPASKGIYQALRDAKVNYARLQPWYPYPRLGVAELEAPRNGRTSWDFSVIDPIVEDFMAAAEGRPVMVNFSTIPQWMIVTDTPVAYPKDPNGIAWNYSPGNQLRDTSLKELVGYFHRLVSWYTQGGFTDEYGKFHASRYHYNFDYWEILNENDQDGQHLFSPEMLVKIYDAVVADLSKLNPGMKFSALALAFPHKGVPYVAKFVDPASHQPGIPVDMFSYHSYMGSADSVWKTGAELEKQQLGYFTQVDGFLETVSRLDSVKQRLAPRVKTYINEFGTLPPGSPADSTLVIPDEYWILSNALFAYAYTGVVKRGVEIFGIAELIDYPGQFAGTTVVHWEKGVPTARYWGMKLLRDHFGPGDKLVASGEQVAEYLVQGFISPKGEKKVLLVNKTGKSIDVVVPGAAKGAMSYVDLSTGSRPPGSAELGGDQVTLAPHAVAVITFKQ